MKENHLIFCGEKNLEITGVNVMNNRMNTRQRDSMICTIENVDNGLNSRSKVPISRGDDSTDDSDQVNSLTEYVNIHKKHALSVHAMSFVPNRYKHSSRMINLRKNRNSTSSEKELSHTNQANPAGKEGLILVKYSKFYERII